jgi:hypothetical protein
MNSWAAVANSSIAAAPAKSPPPPPFPAPKTSTMPSNVDKLIQELANQMQNMALQHQQSKSELLKALQHITPSSNVPSVPRTSSSGRTAVRPTSAAEPSREPSDCTGSSKVYDIAKGRETGVFTSWKRVLAAISGVPFAKYKRFTNRPDAVAWLTEQLALMGVIPPAEDLSDDDGASWLTSVCRPLIHL